MSVQTIRGIEIRPAGVGLFHVVCSECGDCVLDLTIGQTRSYVERHKCDIVRQIAADLAYPSEGDTA